MSQKDSYNRGGFYALLFSFFFSLAFFVYVTFLYQGIDLGEIKSKVDAETPQESSQPAN